MEKTFPDEQLAALHRPTHTRSMEGFDLCSYGPMGSAQHCVIPLTIAELSTSSCRYGDWSAQPEVAQILAEFLNSLGGTSWMNINNGYYDGSGNIGTSQVSHGGTCYDPYSHGKSLLDADVLVRVLAALFRAKQHTDLLYALYTPVLRFNHWKTS